MYDTGYFDEEESAREVSTRARRTRKGASDTARPNLDRQTSKQSQDDLSRKDKTDGGIKRRGTKKIDVEKAKTAVGEKSKEKKPSEAFTGAVMRADPPLGGSKSRTRDADQSDVAH